MSNVFNQNPGLKAGVLCIVLVGFAGMTFFIIPRNEGSARVVQEWRPAIME